MRIKGSAGGNVVFKLPHLNYSRRCFVEVRPANLGDKFERNQLVDKITAVFKARIC